MDTTDRAEDRMGKDMKGLPVEGSELTYQVTGDGPPVLLMHGGFGVIEVWDEIAAELATTHQVIAYDRRGHGRSPNATPDMRVHARDAAELIQHVAGEPAIIVGWSGGASVAIETIRSHADQVRAAVVVEPLFHFRPGGVLRPMLKAHLHWCVAANRAAAETIGRTFFSRRSGGNGWAEIDDERRELLLKDAEGLRVEVRPGPLHRYGGSLEHIKAKDIASWSTPMTYLIGEDTLPAVARCHDRFTSAAPQVRTIEIPGASHLIPWQQPEAVVSAIRSAIRA
ncbi:hypothetical protein BH23ACT6_BH23ACT6_28220 [soil metagenome]